ncbi:MAG: hypothetical protein A2Y33_11015 [Spirochaetes bacterium GWF1_51_8]|nr:MAG: hypothetical protein A2Y33_11015 [Spirochaetes bacterium GWF1_51_8]
MIRKFTLPSIEPPFERILGRMGYNKKKSELPIELEEMIRLELVRVRPLFSPRGNTLDLEIVSLDGGKIVLDGGVEFHSVKLADTLTNCRKVTVMAVTAGPLGEHESLTLIQTGELTRGVILDAIGSETVEAFVNYINGVLASEYGLMGWKPAMRFSPGYGDLQLSVQPVILRLLDGEELGIRAHPETYLLDPQKSVTAFIGWYK